MAADDERHSKYARRGLLHYSPFENLADELVLNVLGSLDDPLLLGQAVLVCQSWSRCASDAAVAMARRRGIRLVPPTAERLHELRGRLDRSATILQRAVALPADQRQEHRRALVEWKALGDSEVARVHSRRLVACMQWAQSVHAFEVLLILNKLDSATLTLHADAFAAQLENDSMLAVREALEALSRIESSVLLQFVPTVFAKATDSEWQVRNACMKVMKGLEPAVLSVHVDGIVHAASMDECQCVRTSALDVLTRLEVASLAPHLEAIVAQLEHDNHCVRFTALHVLDRFDAASLTPYMASIVNQVEHLHKNVLFQAWRLLTKFDAESFVPYASTIRQHGMRVLSQPDIGLFVEPYALSVLSLLTEGIHPCRAQSPPGA